MKQDPGTILEVPGCIPAVCRTGDGGLCQGHAHSKAPVPDLSACQSAQSADYATAERRGTGFLFRLRSLAQLGGGDRRGPPVQLPPLLPRLQLLPLPLLLPICRRRHRRSSRPAHLLSPPRRPGAPSTRGRCPPEVLPGRGSSEMTTRRLLDHLPGSCSILGDPSLHQRSSPIGDLSLAAGPLLSHLLA